MDLAIIFVGALVSIGGFATIATLASRYSDVPRVGVSAMQRVRSSHVGVPAE